MNDTAREHPEAGEDFVRTVADVAIDAARDLAHDRTDLPERVAEGIERIAGAAARADEQQRLVSDLEVQQGHRHLASDSVAERIQGAAEVATGTVSGTMIDVDHAVHSGVAHLAHMAGEGLDRVDDFVDDVASGASDWVDAPDRDVLPRTDGDHAPPPPTPPQVPEPATAKPPHDPAAKSVDHGDTTGKHPRDPNKPEHHDGGTTRHHPTERNDRPMVDERVVHDAGFHYRDNGDLVFTTTDSTTREETVIDADGDVHVKVATTTVLTDEAFHPDGTRDVHVATQESVVGADATDEGTVVESSESDVQEHEYHDTDGSVTTSADVEASESIDVFDVGGNALASGIDGISAWGSTTAAAPEESWGSSADVNPEPMPLMTDDGDPGS